jgi:hypothetical protein
MASTPKHCLDDPAFLRQLEQIEPVIPVAKPPDDPVREVVWFVDNPFVKKSNQTVLKLAGFLIMMGVGAVAAALVFHDRVAQLLR